MESDVLDESVTLQPIDLETPLQIPPDAPATAEEREILTEFDQCVVGMLALLIEDELPEWLKSNRTALAWGLALAAHNFIVGFKRATGQSPELYTPNSSILSSRLMLLPRL